MEKLVTPALQLCHHRAEEDISGPPPKETRPSLLGWMVRGWKWDLKWDSCEGWGSAGRDGHQLLATVAFANRTQPFRFVTRSGDVPCDPAVTSTWNENPSLRFRSQETLLQRSKRQEQEHVGSEASLGVERCKDQTSRDFKIKSDSAGKTRRVLAEAVIYGN